MIGSSPRGRNRGGHPPSHSGDSQPDGARAWWARHRARPGRPPPASGLPRGGTPMQTLLLLSNDLASAVERAARSVVAVHARQRLPSTGVHWRPGIVVTAEHTVRVEEEIRVVWPDGRAAP